MAPKRVPLLDPNLETRVTEKLEKSKTKDEKIILMMTKSLKEKISQVEFLATTNKKLREKLKVFKVKFYF